MRSRWNACTLVAPVAALTAAIPPVMQNSTRKMRMATPHKPTVRGAPKTAAMAPAASELTGMAPVVRVVG